MTLGCVRSVWTSRLTLLAPVFALLTAGCSAILPPPAVAPAAAQARMTSSDDDDYSQLIAQLRSDLNRYNSREIVRKPSIAPQTQTAKGRDREFAARAQALFAPLSSLRIPVVGIWPRDLSDSWHDPREGG